MPVVDFCFVAVNSSVSLRGTCPMGAPPVALDATSSTQEKENNLWKNLTKFKFSGMNTHEQGDIYDIKTDLTIQKYTSVAEAQNLWG